MEKRKLEVGDVVQLSPEYEEYAGMLLVVTSPKEWGCQGYILSDRYIDSVRFKNRAYLRAKWDGMEYVGKLTWMPEDLINRSSDI